MKSVELTKAIRQETIDSEPLFEELIDLTEDIMLRPDQVRKADEGSGDFAAARTPSPWFTQRSIRVTQDKRKNKLPPVELKNTQVNPFIAKRIESLGEGMLDAAFDCLGEDGKVLLESFMNCGEDELKKKVIISNSVLHLIESFAERARFPFKEEDEVGDYPPIRISPKLMGKLPNPEINPTCLGQSILAASFFHKAGVPILHSGVVIASYENEMVSQANLISRLLDFVDDQKLDISANYRKHIADLHNDHLDKLKSHRGFHAAIYAKIGQEDWLQMDPNFGCALVDITMTEYVDNAYEKLSEERKNNGPSGAEDHVFIGGNIEDLCIFIEKRLRNLALEPTKLERLLLDSPPEEMYSQIVTEIFKPFNYQNPYIEQNPDITKIQSDLERLLRVMKMGHSYLQTKISEVIRGAFIDPDEPQNLYSSFQRFHADEDFRRRRVADMQIAPFVLLLKIQSDFFYAKAKYHNSGGFGHTLVDAGLPAYRVGMCAISDVASYYGDDIPLGTWLSYWPSKFNLFEHIDQVPTRAQKSLRKIATKYALKDSYTLTKASTTGILNDVLTDSYEGGQLG